VSGPLGGALVSFLVLLLVLATDLWVYEDAKASDKNGTPVTLSFGTMTVDTPAAWFFACVFLWLVFFSLYLLGRSR